MPHAIGTFGGVVLIDGITLNISQNAEPRTTYTSPAPELADCWYAVAPSCLLLENFLLRCEANFEDQRDFPFSLSLLAYLFMYLWNVMFL